MLTQLNLAHAGLDTSARLNDDFSFFCIFFLTQLNLAHAGLDTSARLDDDF